MPRLIVLGCGTGIGKTRVGVALLRELRARGATTLGLKPVETGLESEPDAATLSDAAALSRAATFGERARGPLYGFRMPVSPHLAARIQGLRID